MILIWVIVVVLVGMFGAVMVAVIGNDYANVSREPRFAEAVGNSGERNGDAPRKPDMSFAARAYARVAMMRVNNIEADFHALEAAHARIMREGGATEHEVLSALWGGAYGMDVDLNTFRSNVKDHVDAFEDTKRELGRTPPNSDDPKIKFNMAATAHLALVMADKPNEYERFLAYMKSN
ncbi:MAG: hypothetical protein EON93_21585 [Burkholderiales bacterium]|nr:MAG: hypothetical protein EON93_21585 [Burkholderiales bacterium]